MGKQVTPYVGGDGGGNFVEHKFLRVAHDASSEPDEKYPAQQIFQHFQLSTDNNVVYDVPGQLRR